MDPLDVQSATGSVWTLASRQYGRVSHAQLIELGIGRDAIKHRVATGRLHPVGRGVYAVGRRDNSREGRWMTAILTCGLRAVLSHGSALAFWGLGSERRGLVEVSVPLNVRPRHRRLIVHRRSVPLSDESIERFGIPVTSPGLTLIDVALRLGSRGLEAAINEADTSGLVTPDGVRATAERHSRIPGSRLVRNVLGRQTFRLMDSELERRFLRLAGSRSRRRDRRFALSPHGRSAVRRSPQGPSARCRRTHPVALLTLSGPLRGKRHRREGLCDRRSLSA